MVHETAIVSSLFSCSQKEQIRPIANTPSNTIPSSSIKTVNGRLVFDDWAAFDQTFNALVKTQVTQDIATWEKQFSFISLRAAYDAEIVHLEELDTNGKPAPSYDLIAKFGFPTVYTSLINSNGEYQVGNKIYWFHDGFKYQADSEEELTTIKHNPSSAKAKFIAGAKPQESRSVSTTANRTTGFYNPSGYNTSDDKYTNYFALPNDPRSKRRILYGANVYYEDRGIVNGAFRFFKSSLNILVKYEYYSDGRGKWYPSSGENFTWYANFNYDATCSAPCITGSTGTLPTRTGNINQQETYSSGLHGITLAVEEFYTSTTCGEPYNMQNIRWNFEVNGIIQGYPSAYYPGLNYNVNGILW